MFCCYWCNERSVESYHPERARSHVQQRQQQKSVRVSYRPVFVLRYLPSSIEFVAIEPKDLGGFLQGTIAFVVPSSLSGHSVFGQPPVHGLTYVNSYCLVNTELPLAWENLI